MLTDDSSQNGKMRRDYSMAKIQALRPQIALAIICGFLQINDVHAFDLSSTLDDIRTTPTSGKPVPTIPTIEDLVSGDNNPGLEILAINPVAEFAQRVSDLGFSVNDELAFPTLDLDVSFLGLPSGLPLDAGLALLRDSFPGIVVDRDSVFELAQSTASGRSYWRRVIGWDAPTKECGAGARIGIIDGAVHNSRMFSKANYTYKDFAPHKHKAAAIDHGTAVLGLLATPPDQGQYAGLLPGADYYAANVFFSKDGKAVAGTRSMLRAIGWLLSEDVHVINMSLAGPDNEVFARLIERSSQRNVTIVAAAGNKGPGSFLAPAMYPEVIGVAASNERLQAYGDSSDVKVSDFSAPGVGIWTLTAGGGRYQSGTSFAAPFLTAIVGYLKASNPKATTEEIRSYLSAYVTDAGPKGPDNRFGFGVVRANHGCR